MVAAVVAVLTALPPSAAAAVRRSPPTTRRSRPRSTRRDAGDIIDVAPGRHCGARVDRQVTLLGHGRATIIGCADGPALSNGVRAGFQLPGADGASGASGTHIEGFVFDGRGISADNLEPLGVAIIATFASHVRVERNVILGTVQGITNTAGDSWLIVHNVIRDLTRVRLHRRRCAAAATASSSRSRAIRRRARRARGRRQPAQGQLVFGNVIEGAIPDGFEAFDMAGVFVFAADRTARGRATACRCPTTRTPTPRGSACWSTTRAAACRPSCRERATRSSRSTTAATASARSNRRHGRREHAGAGAVRKRRHRDGRGHGRTRAHAAPPSIRSRGPLPALYAPLDGPELDALLAHARALVGVELGALADGLGLPSPSGACARRAGRDRSSSRSWAPSSAARAAPTSPRSASSSRRCR